MCNADEVLTMILTEAWQKSLEPAMPPLILHSNVKHGSRRMETVVECDHGHVTMLEWGLIKTKIVMCYYECEFCDRIVICDSLS